MHVLDSLLECLSDCTTFVIAQFTTFCIRIMTFQLSLFWITLYVDLTSPGVVVLDITVVPDVYGPSWWPDRSGPGAARWFPEHCPGLGAWRSCRAPRIPQTDVRKFVIHGGLSCSPNVCGGPDETQPAMSVVPVDGMTEFQVDMESLRWDCKREFGSGRPGDCPHCDLYVNISLSRHIMTFHLALAKLCRFPIPWCSVLKGTTQDCVEHIRLRHHADSAVVASKLGKYFPPWTLTRATWTAALGPKVSSIATDVMLIHQHVAGLFNLPHLLLRGSFMAKLCRFTRWASAEARSAAKHSRHSSSESTPTPLRPARRAPDSAPTAHKSARTTAIDRSAAGALFDAFVVI